MYEVTNTKAHYNDNGNLPFFQRNDITTKVQYATMCVVMILRLRLGVITIGKYKNEEYILDGHQRTKAIKKVFDGEYKFQFKHLKQDFRYELLRQDSVMNVLNKIEGLSFDEWPKNLQKIAYSHEIAVDTNEYDSVWAMQLEYLSLNSGKTLNSQEMRAGIDDELLLEIKKELADSMEFEDKSKRFDSLCMVDELITLIIKAKSLNEAIQIMKDKPMSETNLIFKQIKYIIKATNDLASTHECWTKKKNYYRAALWFVQKVVDSKIKVKDADTLKSIFEKIGRSLEGGRTFPGLGNWVKDLRNISQSGGSMNVKSERANKLFCNVLPMLY